jgi:hypothetical protein
MQVIDNLPIKSATKSQYKNALKNHCLGINLRDIEAVKERLKPLNPATQLVCLNAISHLLKPHNKDILEEKMKVSEKCKADGLKRPLPTQKKSFDRLIREAYKRPATKENGSLIVLLYLMKHHPRRFSDYFLLETQPSDSANYLDQTNNIIVFNFFKNSTKPTAGEKQVEMHPEVKRETSAFIKNWGHGRLFPMNQRRLRHLMKIYDFPLCTANRKIQETEAIENGENHDEVARRFNHSVMTQVVHYVKKS